MRINGQLKSALPPTLRGVFFPIFLAVFWAEAAVGGGIQALHHTEVVQCRDTPYYSGHICGGGEPYGVSWAGRSGQGVEGGGRRDAAGDGG